MMGTEIATRKEGGALTAAQVQLVREHVAPDLNDSELKYFLEVSASIGLNPLRRQVYAMKRGGRISIQTGIDGYRAIAHRTGEMAGCPEPEYQYDENGSLVSAKVIVYRTVSGNRCEFSHRAFWAEYCQTARNGAPTSMWAKMPHTMLGKCAEACALRKAFPEELTGVYTAEEMQQADNTTPMAAPIEAEVIEEPAPKKARKPRKKKAEPEPSSVNTEQHEKPKHDKDWPKTYKAFMAWLDTENVNYNNLAQWCEEQQFQRPSVWTEQQRKDFKAEWPQEHRKLYLVWLSVKNGEVTLEEAESAITDAISSEGAEKQRREEAPTLDEDNLPF
jgi:phage recombination protein Bet